VYARRARATRASNPKPPQENFSPAGDRAFVFSPATADAVKENPALAYDFASGAPVFANGAVTGAFSYAFASGLGSRNSGPTLSQGTGGTAFVGGFFDYWTHGPVYDQYLEYIRLNPGAGAAYFTWDQGGALASWIDANGGAVSVIGHSYGGDTAASVVAAGHGVNSLTTVDPVGWTRPSYSAVAANSGSWTNFNAVGGGWSTPNIIAGIGGAWNSGPSGYATIFRNINQDHAGVMYQCGQPGSC
jgi:hypothetical protein